MARKHPLINGDRGIGEGMVIGADNKSVQRGRRKQSRTEVCRPCMFWHVDTPDQKMEGVVLDLTPHGMRIRTLEEVTFGAEIMVQLMRGDEYEQPLSAPHRVGVMRVSEAVDGFHDLGCKIEHKHIRRAGEALPVRIEKIKPVVRRKTRMHTLDITLDDQPKREGRYRG